MALRYVKIFSFRQDEDLELAIQKWVDETNSIIVGLHSVGSSPTVIVLYEKQSVPAVSLQGADWKAYGEKVLAAANEEAREIQSSASESVPQPAKPSSVPHVHAYTNKDGKRKPVKVMAGIFPVEEGAPLHPEDDEPAPTVLMAEGVDLSRYRGMIVGGENG
jgi:hypothetical protein